MTDQDYKGRALGAYCQKLWWAIIPPGFPAELANSLFELFPLYLNLSLTSIHRADSSQNTLMPHPSSHPSLPYPRPKEGNTLIMHNPVWDHSRLLNLKILSFKSSGGFFFFPFCKTYPPSLFVSHNIAFDYIMCGIYFMGLNPDSPIKVQILWA